MASWLEELNIMTRHRLLTLLLVASAVFGQVDTGSIAGIVKDNGGAVIPSAAITVSNTGTGYQIKLATNGDGVYVSPPLPAGMYRVEVSQSGFRTAAKEFRLSIGERPAVDFVLELGAVNESIIVQA